MVQIMWCEKRSKKSLQEHDKTTHSTPTTRGWGVCSTPVEKATLMWDERGLTALGFGPTAACPQAWGFTAETFPVRCDKQAQVIQQRLWEGEATVTLIVEGSDVALRVYRYVMTIPSGETCTYGQVALAIGLGTQGARAVGRALGANALSWIIPCHRVVRCDGSLGGYRWGIEVKQVLLKYECRMKAQGFQERKAP